MQFSVFFFLYIVTYVNEFVDWFWWGCFVLILLKMKLIRII